MEKQKVALCLFGVIPRSIKFTYNSIKTMIVDELKTVSNIEVDIIVFNLNIKDATIDGKTVNQDDIKIIENIVYYEEDFQENADIETFKRYGNVNGEILRMRRDFSPKLILNSMRQLYSEYRLGLMLEKVKHKYVSSIVCGPDYFLLNKINVTDINNSILNKNVIYTTPTNPADGCTNGFYIGHPETMVKLLKRYELIGIIFPTNKDYEYTVLRALQMNNIYGMITNMIFFKIRNDKSIARQGIMTRSNYDNYYEYVKKKLL